MKIKKELFHYFENAGTKTNYQAHDIIYMQEDDAKNLYLILKGRVRVFLLSPSGEEITLEILDQGRIFGESSFIKNSSRITNVTAITDVELISCRLDNLLPYFNESKDLTLSLLQSMSQTCDYLALQVKKAYSYDRFAKVASFLLEQTQTDHPYKDIFHSCLPYSHDEIASIVGLSRVTVTKVLNEFVENGYIKIQYKKIYIIPEKRQDFSEKYIPDL
ncbi:MAG: Crp/Fnr family transcriptional regulator [Coprobacillus sp.]